ncbi:hypothetical protein BC941DRAFT_502218 [Chlamydoabsidia padenii]|nr:hypothetical protein BC941DRAFT_502218 [Chlamydoabsidia padenii]
MVHHGLALTLSLISSMVLCQASSFVYEDLLAYPRYKVELTEKKIPESSVFGPQQPKSKQIGLWNTQDHRGIDHNQVIMMTGRSQPFLCTIPDITAQQNQHSTTKPDSSSFKQETQDTIERGLELLKPLEKTCLYFHSYGYWTYEFCHLKHVRQFHVDASKTDNDGKPILDDKSTYILGTFSQQQQGTPSTGVLRAQQQGGTHISTITQADTTPISSSSSTTLQRIDGQHVLVQHLGNGTPCDITHQPRAVDIYFQCGADTDRITYFEEVSTCHYHMTISTPRLCDDIELGAKKSESHPIKCNPIVPDHWINDHQEQEEQGTTDDMEETAATQTTTVSVMETTEPPADEKDTATTTSDAWNDMGKTELVGIISNLAKQVEQLQNSMEQHRGQQIFFLDQNGQVVLGPGVSHHDPLQQAAAIKNKDTITPESLINQFLSQTSTKDTKRQQPRDGTESQKRNKESYEKNYYSMD